MLYHSNAYQPSPVASFWQDSAGPAPDCPPLEGEQDCQIAVIGAGYTGLSAALHLARDHDIDVRVIDSAQPGWGASGRNGGFCCIGSAKLSYLRMLRRFGLDATRNFFSAQCQAVEFVAELAVSEALDIERTGQGELLLAHKTSRVKSLLDEREFLQRTFGLQTRFLSVDECRQQGLVNAECHGGLHNPIGFGLQPLKYTYGLTRASLGHGAIVHGGSPVVDWRYDGGRHRLVTPDGILTADRVVVASNGYTGDRLHPAVAGCLLPVPSDIIVTRPLSNDELDAQGWSQSIMAFDSRDLLHYFRLLPSGRFLFGGRGGLNASAAGVSRTYARLTRHFQRAFPAWRDVEITHCWGGLICMAYDLVPHLTVLDERSSVFAGLSYHGNGVAMASWTGRMLADLAVGADDLRLPAVMTIPLPRFPLPMLRLWYLRLATLGYHVRDEWF